MFILLLWMFIKYVLYAGTVLDAVDTAETIHEPMDCTF